VDYMTCSSHLASYKSWFDYVQQLPVVFCERTV
jgi:hypothetical protein